VRLPGIFYGGAGGGEAEQYGEVSKMAGKSHRNWHLNWNILWENHGKT